jgi:hypothetical protein
LMHTPEIALFRAVVSGQPIQFHARLQWQQITQTERSFETL